MLKYYRLIRYTTVLLRSGWKVRVFWKESCGGQLICAERNGWALAVGTRRGCLNALLSRMEQNTYCVIGPHLLAFATATDEALTEYWNHASVIQRDIQADLAKVMDQ